MARLYDREKLGAYLQEHYPEHYGPFKGIKLQAVEEGGRLLAEIIRWPKDVPIPTVQEVEDFSPTPPVATAKEILAELSAKLDSATTIMALRRTLQEAISALEKTL